MATTLTTGRRWALESYERLNNNTWEKVNNEKQSVFLVLDYPKLLLVNEEVTMPIHHVDLSGEAGNIQGQYANSIIGIHTKYSDGRSHKFRIRFAHGNGKTGSDYCAEVVDELKQFFPVKEHPSHSEKKTNTGNVLTQKLVDVTKGLLLENSATANTEEASILSDSDIKDAIDEFMLRPEFPYKVVEFWKTLGLIN